MKKRNLFFVVMLALLACLFATVISAAEPSHIEGEWIYADDDTTKLAIRDTEGNPLIWYMNGEELKYVRADQTDTSKDVYVVYKISSGGSGFYNGVSPQKTLKDIDIYDGGVQIEGSGINSQIVLFNMERLDIDALNGWLFGNKNGCCLLMRGMVFPSSLKYIGQEGLTNVRMVQYWNLENTQLEYIESCNFGSCSTLTQEATGGVFACPRTLARPIEVQSSLIKTYVMNPYFSYDISVKWNQFFRSCSQLEKIICPAQVSMGFGEEAFRSTPAQFLVFITGTKEEAEQSIANTASYYNGSYLAAKVISYEEYQQDAQTYDNATNQVYVIYGYNFCDAFYGGSHSVSENDVVSVKDFVSEIHIGRYCTRTECGVGQTIKTIAPIFKCLGIATTEEPNEKGEYSITVGYKIDYSAYKEYLNYGVLEFGLVAAAVDVTGNAPLAVQDGSVVVLNPNKTIVVPQGKLALDYVDFKLSGITEDKNGYEIVMSIYVYDGESIDYLDAPIAVNISK